MQLCRHSRANHVMQHLIEYGTPRHRQWVYEVLAGALPSFARHQIASHVVEKALDSTDPAGCALLSKAALRDPQVLVGLACGRQSQFVVRRLLRLSKPHSEMVRSVLLVHLGSLQSSKYGS